MNSQENIRYQKALSRLNSQQRKAVETIYGPVMVIAGPGTGKTQLLSTRIGYILEHSDAYASNILCLTYTNAGVVAIQNRLQELIGAEALHVTVATFHSFAEMILQKYTPNSERESILLDNLTQKKIVRSLIDTIPFGTPLKDKVTSVDYAIRFTIHLFETIRKEKLDPILLKEQYENELKVVYESDKFRYQTSRAGAFQKGDLKKKDWEVYERRIQKHIQALSLYDPYLNILIENNYRDYYSSITDVIALISSNEDIRYSLLEQYHFVMVDEYQDTNGSQLEILRAIFHDIEDPNILIVGDEDQAIYKFQGANIQNIFDFYNTYIKPLSTELQDNRLIILNQNYRSSPNIIETSKYLMNHGKERISNITDGQDFQKDFVASHPEYQNINDTVEIIYTELADDIYIPVANQISELIQAGQNPEEIAVLFPNNKQALDFSRYLQVLDVSFSLSSKIDIAKDSLVLQIIRLLKIISDIVSKSQISHSSIHNILLSPWSSIGLYEVSEFWSTFAEERKSGSTESILHFWANYTSIPSIQRQYTYLQKCSKHYSILSIERFLHYTLDQFNIKEWAMSQSDGLEIIQKIQSLEYWLIEQKKLETISDMASFIKLFEDYVEEDVEIPYTKSFEGSQSVYLSTYHSSKGLEYEYVYVMYAGRYSRNNQSIYLPLSENKLAQWLAPNAKKSELKDDNEVDSELEERRRLLYVAMTRAKKKLILTDYLQKKSSTDSQNPFIPELPSQGLGSGMVSSMTYSISEEEYIKFHAANQSQLDTKIDKLYENQYIDNRIQNFTLSHSSIDLYLKCPLSFYLEKIINIPSESNFHLLMGDFYHKLLEKYFLQIQEDHSLNTYTYILSLAKNKLEEYKNALTAIEYENILSSLPINLEIFHRDYLSSIENFDYKIEEKIEISISNILINGKIDKYSIENNQAQIVDFKTGSHEKAKSKLKPPTTPKKPDEPKIDELYGGDYWRQAHIYALLMKTRYPHLDINTVQYTYILPENGEIHTDKIVISPENEHFVINLIQQVHQDIQAKKFDGCGQPDCKWCSNIHAASSN